MKRNNSDDVSHLRIEPFDGSNGVAAAPAADREQDLAFTEWFSRPRSRPLHVRSLLREKKVILGLIYEVSTCFVRLDK